MTCYAIYKLKPVSLIHHASKEDKYDDGDYDYDNDNVDVLLTMTF